MIKRTSLYLLSLLLLFACNSSANSSSSGEPMPSKPDYTMESCWYTNSWQSADEAVDVFYILPTCIFDWSDSEGVTYHYGDVYNQEHRAAQLYSYELAEDIFGSQANLYAPYYRQLTLDVWMEGEEAVERLFPAAMADVSDAFEYYMQSINSDRPFIIAGFSQGGKCVVELLKSLSPQEYARMVAAYVIGYKVTSSDLQSANILGATRCDDTGVTICYNSVSNIEAINDMISASQLCINPVSWSVEATPAQLNESVTVSVETTHHVLIVYGLDSEALFVPKLETLFKEGNYHLQELELYKDYLRENVAVRAAIFGE